MGFLARLLASDDRSVDSVIVGGMLGMIVLCGLSTYDVVAHSAAFGPVNFGAGAGSILGAIGAGKRLRDGEKKPDAA